MASFEVLYKCATPTTGEGPFYIEKDNSLMFVDILSSHVYKGDISAGTFEKRKIDKEFTSVIVPKNDEDFLIGCGQEILNYNWNTKILTPIAKVDEDRPGQTRINDGKVDRSGRFFVGTMGLETAPAVLTPELGTLNMLSDGKITRLESKIDLSNGLEWSADNSTFYFIDTLAHKIFSYKYDSDTGLISGKQTLLDFAKLNENHKQVYGFPDGMTIDNQDRLWVAMFNSGKILCVDTATSQIVQTLQCPVKGTTSCCFGGPNYDTLFVTTTCLAPGEDNKELAGSIFKVSNVGAKGLPMSFAK